MGKRQRERESEREQKKIFFFTFDPNVHTINQNEYFHRWNFDEWVNFKRNKRKKNYFCHCKSISNELLIVLYCYTDLWKATNTLNENSCRGFFNHFVLAWIFQLIFFFLFLFQSFFFHWDEPPSLLIHFESFILFYFYFITSFIFVVIFFCWNAIIETIIFHRFFAFWY